MQIRPELAVGFVIYHPTGEFYRRLKMASSAGFKLYVFDNSPSETKVKDITKYCSNIKYITAGKNLGLGVGLSVINATAYYEEYSSLIFFDQDTEFTVETLSYIYRFYCSKKSDGIEKYAVVMFTSRTDDSKLEYEVKDVLVTISSGSLFILDRLVKLNWHNEKYFVDGVDYEVCLRARLKGFKVGVCHNTPGFDHAIEQPDKFVRLCGKSIPLRRYNVTRIFDAMGAYSKLIFSAVKSLDFKFAGKMLRSCAIYVLGQVLSRVFVKQG